MPSQVSCVAYQIHEFANFYEMSRFVMIVSCFFRTWASVDDGPRIILISADHPCELDETYLPNVDKGAQNVVVKESGGEGGGDGGVGLRNKMAPHVQIAETCDHTSFGSGMLYIAVLAQANRGARVTVVAAPLGKVSCPWCVVFVGTEYSLPFVG